MHKMTRVLDLGIKARDVVTKFQGIITGKVTYMTGCDQYVLTPEVNDKGEAQDSRWFDVTRLEVVDEKPIKLPVDPSETRENGPGPTPPPTDVLRGG